MANLKDGVYSNVKQQTETFMLIGELSEKTGFSKDTIRFYEKTGLLVSSYRRGENNYRYYNDEAVERLAFISQGKALGFTLKEIRKVIDKWDTLPLEDKVRRIGEKIEEVDAKTSQLQQFRCYLVEKLQRL